MLTLSDWDMLKLFPKRELILMKYRGNKITFGYLSTIIKFISCILIQYNDAQRGGCVYSYLKAQRLLVI